MQRNGGFRLMGMNEDPGKYPDKGGNKDVAIPKNFG